MQELEHKQAEQALPTSQPVTLAALATQSALDDNPDEIFLNAVAEIDTQPDLLRPSQSGAHRPRPLPDTATRRRERQRDW